MSKAMLQAGHYVRDSEGSRAAELEAEPGGVVPSERAEIKVRSGRATRSIFASGTRGTPTLRPLSKGPGQVLDRLLPACAALMGFGSRYLRGWWPQFPAYKKA